MKPSRIPVKSLLVSIAICTLALQSSFAGGTLTSRSDGIGPTTEDSNTVFTATRAIEHNAISVRVRAHAYGEKEKGCLDNNKNGFFDKAIQTANDFFDNLFKPGSQAARDRADKVSKSNCATVTGQLKIVVNGVETIIDSFYDYDFDRFDKVLEKTYGTEWNGKVVTAKFSVATNMNKNNIWEVFVESTVPN